MLGFMTIEGGIARLEARTGEVQAVSESVG